MTIHALHETAQRGTEAWQSRCLCGWASPWVETRRTAIRSHQTHKDGEPA